MGDDRADMLQGTLDLLILKTLTLGAMHGWGISQRIRELSEDVLQINQGSLYPALHRLEHRDWVRSQWGVSENNRKAKFYRITPSGAEQLGEERGGWRRFADAVDRVLEADTDVLGASGGRGEAGGGGEPAPA